MASRLMQAAAEEQDMAKLQPIAKPMRVECCGCRMVASMPTINREGWIVYPKPSIHPHNADRRSHLGWCRSCQQKFGVMS